MMDSRSKRMIQEITVMLLIVFMLFSVAACDGKVTPGNSEQSQTTSESESTTSETGIPLPENKTIKVAFYGGWWEDPAKYDFIYEDFITKYPGYTLVKIETMAESKDLLAAIQANNQPDYWLGSDTNWASYATCTYERMMTPLDEYLTKDTEVNFDNLDSKVMELFKFIDGKYYGLPYATSHLCLVWNKEMFAKSNLPDRAPVTWSEMEDFSRRLIKLSDGTASQVGFSVAGTEGPYLYQMLPTMLIQQFGSDGITLDLMNPKVAQTIEFCDKFYDMIKGKLTPGTSYSFTNGNCGMAIASLSQMTGITQSGIDFGIAPVPRPDEIDKQVVPSYIWQFSGIPINCENPDGGWLFTKFITTDVTYTLSKLDMQASPKVSLPAYAAHGPTNERIDTLFMSQADELTKTIYEERNELFLTGEFFGSGATPLTQKLVDISNDWGTKRTSEGLTISAYLQGMQNEYNGELSTWKSGMEQQGWQFPENQPAIPPQ